ncbi:DEAD/DEAH box helicase family protein [Desulfosarcina widdelii]|nr:DEAD/DEAH box helicase family protein [Desulfosarcina widdelii]
MPSTNFEFMRPNWPELADLCGFAEIYAHTDPASALIKLRSLVENIVQRIYEENQFPKEYNASLNDLMTGDTFRAAVPPVVVQSFHLIRKAGNRAAHGRPVDTDEALKALKDAFDLSRWFFVISGGSRENWPVYQAPMKPDAPDETKRHTLAKNIALQEARLRDVLGELEASRLRAVTAEKKAEELERLLQTGMAAADELAFNEAETRQRLIDAQLMDAGWHVAPDGENTADVSQEEEIKYQPTKTGVGYADYVLWDDDGTPLAVVEAKRTVENAEKGREQAALYADGLEKMYPGARPAIFYTNGHDIYLWDDVQNYPPRKLFGFYSRESLRNLHYQRKNRKPLDTIHASPEIAGRLYQLEAIKRVCERFGSSRRKALIVQATGTGKTRVAIALTDLLIRAAWVKRVLFLCDRKELRKQAKNTFVEFIQEPLTIVSAKTASDRDHRIYLATYPAMNKIFQSFDPGFFNLIIADESHRSIYNRYRGIFRYFDGLQVGLTATPVDFISRNTFRLFGCNDQDPTANYTLATAIAEGYLVPYEVYTHTTRFLRKGIKYRDLTEAQRRELEEDGEDPETFDYDAREVDKQIFNKDTNRMVLRNLMENGIREETGQHPGKTIIFARSHDHAVLLATLFDELYPQYGGKFCRVIDNYDPRAEQLIDYFKASGGGRDDLTVAISVDMLDTGIDVPEIVNLVFAKPVKSKVKFQQMIGRGTRLRPDLFGPGSHKNVFRIFDHWGNFDYFDEVYEEAQQDNHRPLMRQVFESRLQLAEIARSASETAVFENCIELIRRDIDALPDRTIAVREKWKEKKALQNMATLRQFSAATRASLTTAMAPLMQWVDIRGQADIIRFDGLMTDLQTALIQKRANFQRLKERLLSQVAGLRRNLNQVKAKQSVIDQVERESFWESVTAESLETIRLELRGIMQFREKTPPPPKPYPKVIDVKDDGEIHEKRDTFLTENDMAVYRRRVEEALLSLFDTNETLKKIKAGEPVSREDLDALVSLVLTRHPDVDLKLLREFYQGKAYSLEFIIRSIIGMDSAAVRERFENFAKIHADLDARQLQFMRMLQAHISRHGSIELETLYEAPFTTLSAEGIDGVFTDERQVDALIGIIETFQPEASGLAHVPPDYFQGVPKQNI